MSAESKKILVVDDDAALREALMVLLRTRGYRVFEAVGGHAALAVLENQEVDLVISDMRMPDGSGIELLKAIRKKNPTLPKVILMSGYSDCAVDQIKTSGAQAIFSKPFVLKDFLAAVAELLG